MMSVALVSTGFGFRLIAYLRCYADGLVLARSQGFVRVSELCNVSLPALKKVRAKTGGDNHVEGPEDSDVRHPCDELLPCALAQLRVQ